jgi:hypothetical protein
MDECLAALARTGACVLGPTCVDLGLAPSYVLSISLLVARSESCHCRPRRAFIPFEGVDRCGKTTQANRLVEHLKKEGPTEFMRFPDESCAF